MLLNVHIMRVVIALLSHFESSLKTVLVNLDIDLFRICFQIRRNFSNSDHISSLEHNPILQMLQQVHGISALVRKRLFLFIITIIAEHIGVVRNRGTNCLKREGRWGKLDFIF